MNPTTYSAFSDELQKIAISMRLINRVGSEAHELAGGAAPQLSMGTRAQKRVSASIAKAYKRGDELRSVGRSDAGSKQHELAHALSLGKEAAEAGGTPWQQKAKAMGGHLLAFGGGTAIGATVGYLVNEAVKAVSKKPEGIPTRYLIAAAPIIGAGFGLAYNLAKAKEMEEMTRVHKDPDHKPGAG